MALPPYMRQSQPPPPVQIGQTIEARIDSIELVEGQYGKQYQFMMTLTIQGKEHQQRAWVKYYDTPTPKTKLGKLCLAVHRVTQQMHQNVQSAVDALKTYGRVYITVTKFTTADDGTMYPRFGIIADYLPGEQPGQVAPIPTTLPPQQVNQPLPPQIPSTLEAMKAWIAENQGLIGQAIPSEVYNKMDKAVIDELVANELAYSKYDMPHLDDRAKEFL